MAHIIYDTREDRSLSDVEFQTVVKKYSLKMPITLTKKQITHGDFVICNEHKIFAIVERKAMHDFQSSMISERLDSQINSLISMRAKYGCHIFLLLEGKVMQSQTNEYRGVTFAQLDAKRRSILYGGVGIIYSRDPQYTMEQIALMALDSYKYGNGNTKYGGGEAAHSIMSAIPDEHKDEATALWVKLTNMIEVVPCEFVNDIPAPMLQPKEISLAQQQLNMWCAIKFITTKTAPILMSKWSLVEFVNTKPNISELMIDGRKFGVKKMENVYANINEGTKARILECVKGVSKDLSKQLATYDLDKIPDTFQYRGRNIKKLMSHILNLLNNPVSP